MMGNAYKIRIGKFEGKRELSLREPDLDGRLTLETNVDELGYD